MYKHSAGAKILGALAFCSITSICVSAVAQTSSASPYAKNCDTTQRPRPLECDGNATSPTRGGMMRGPSDDRSEARKQRRAERRDAPMPAAPTRHNQKDRMRE